MFTPSQNELSETFIVCAEGDDRFISNYKFYRPVCAGATQKQMFTPPSVRSTLVCGVKHPELLLLARTPMEP